MNVGAVEAEPDGCRVAAPRRAPPGAAPRSVRRPRGRPAGPRRPPAGRLAAWTIEWVPDSAPSNRDQTTTASPAASSASCGRLGVLAGGRKARPERSRPRRRGGWRSGSTRLEPSKPQPDRGRVAGRVERDLGRLAGLPGSREVERFQPPRRGRGRGGSGLARADPRRPPSDQALPEQPESRRAQPLTLQVRVSVADSARPSAKDIEARTNGKGGSVEALGGAAGGREIAVGAAAVGVGPVQPAG